MAHQYKWGLIHESDVFLINDEVVNCITFFVVSGGKLRWIDPLALVHDWMLWSNLKTGFHRAEISEAILAIKLD